MTLTTRLLCPHCGSDELGRDAVARWDGKDWVLAGLLDDISCNNCGQDGIEPREAKRALTIKEWAEKQWRAPGVLNAKHGNVFTHGFAETPVLVTPGREYKDYYDAAARKRRRQLAMYTPSLTDKRRAELTLTDKTDRHGNPIWRR